MTSRFAQGVLDALGRGDPLEAERACRSRLDSAPDDDQARALLPIALLHQGRPGDAVPLLERLVREQTQEPSHVTNLGLALIDLGRYEDAILALAPAAHRWPANSTILTALGQARLQRGFAETAVADLHAALDADRTNALAASLLARALQESGERERGAALAEQVLATEPADPAVLSELALALVGAQRDNDAENCLKAAITAEPVSGTARVLLAQLYERQNRLDEAAAELARCRDSRVPDALSGLMRGRVLRRQKRYAAALAELETVVCRPDSDPVVAEAAIERGFVLDALGRSDEAFTSFARGNESMLEIEAGDSTSTPADLSPGEWLLTTHGRKEVTGWSAPVAPATDTPIFVVGFPRSGTTLLENILDAHPDLQAMEEQPAIDAVISLLEAGGTLGVALAQMNEERATECRRAYWQAVDRYLARVPGRRLVDRYPLNMARLALIERVFPGAPIVLLIRHPCDVVLSCFMHNFRIRDGTVGFHRLANGARIYDRVMQKWLAESEAFAPRLFVIRYEDLVTDYDGNVRRLAGFLELPWDDRMLDPAGHARSRGRIHTPSYSQVVQPIYADSIGRWRRYRRYFEEALPVLERWIRHWGYQETET